MIAKNILVSKNQIIIRSVPFDLEKEKWNEKNIIDGLIWNHNYIMLDPLVDNSFGAWFIIDKKDNVEIDKDSVRAALLPFDISSEKDFSINTISESIYLFRNSNIDEISEKEKGKYYPLNLESNIIFTERKYSVLFEICLGFPPIKNPDREVFYKFTFIKNDNPVFKVLKEDDYGWKLNTCLHESSGNLITK
jgi:hypothetical protein